VDGPRETKLARAQIRATARDLLFWAIANSLAGGLVGLAIALFSGAPGAIARFAPVGVLFGNAIGFAAGLSARFVLPRYVALPPYIRFPLAIITLLAGGAFGTVLVIIMNPLAVLYEGRLLSLLLIVDSIVAAVVGLIVYNYERMRDAIELGYRALAETRVKEERLRELAARSELKALKAQINPHFLFNALNSVSALIAIDPDAAQRTLERLAGVLRGTLLASEKESIPLRQELEVVDAYLDVEKARFGKRLRVEQAVSAEAGDVPVPPLIVQPVVENAIRHGISPQVETVRILAEVRGGRLHIVVEDDGAGMDPCRRETLMAGGFGLRNVRDRLTTRFGKGEWFKVESASGEGMRVELVVPVEASDQEETP
jgi:sensor histidine kinase YesM